LFDPDARDGYFSVRLSIEDVLCSDYLSQVEGLRRIKGTSSVARVDLKGGTVRATYRLDPNGEPVLITLFPEER
jgi:hypothetical protein